ncbi:hypothetical protein A9Q77_05470 [Marinomonas sp. 42_23_T18]|nr:hypothetical protein A9Q77_05470 [Marinomonas sp. 42_23_T18]
MFSIILATVFLLILLFFNLTGTLSSVLLSLYLSMSLITFCVFAFDKRASIRAHPRVRERTLFSLILCCGWPGALLAQQLIRHKSVKIRFIRLSWSLIAFNLMLLSLFVIQG